MSDLPEPINPNNIIELQLKYLHTKAQNGALTDGECRSLEALIRCRILLDRVPEVGGVGFPEEMSVEDMVSHLE